MSWRDRPYAREESGYGGGGFGSRLRNKSMVMWLLYINVALFFIQAIFGASGRGSWVAPFEYGYFSYDKAIVQLQLWRWITYQFIHAGFFHILFNMLMLYWFGPMMEQWWGSRRFLAFYLLCGSSGAAMYTLLTLVPGLISMSGPLVGASGAIMGVMVGCMMVAPRQRISLLFPPVSMQMRTLIMFLLGLSILRILIDDANAGGEAAHLGGAALGFVLMKFPGSLSFADGFGGYFANMSKKNTARRAERVRERTLSEDAEVDRVLDKVRDHGLHSLTSAEKKVLHRATERQQR